MTGSRDLRRESDKVTNGMPKGKHILNNQTAIYRLDVYYRDRARWEHMDNSAKKEQKRVEAKQE